ncbi:hypothetical protein CPS_4477 [Colwellia psychrerythraea 34H]|uniref:Uncharacterized protein n=1 Tax=Colwellia psychrerythraea (strain 34H / ATCC BAA-681) TaxID=167879 RepID=Q47VP7_COLP3|nr:hypothetical protein CPS_4477 [Colwellia psychrerythraea 34H]
MNNNVNHENVKLYRTIAQYFLLNGKVIQINNGIYWLEL